MQGRDDTAAVHRRASPATTASSSTTSSRRCSSASPTTVRRFLLETVDPRPAHRPLCDAVTGGTDGPSDARAARSGEPVPRPARRPPPLVPLPPPLRRRAPGPARSTSSPTRVAELHRRASDWYEANGDRPEAIGHAMAGDDFERAAELIELAAPGHAPDPPGGDVAALARSAARRGVRRPARARPSTLVGARMATGDIDRRRARCSSCVEAALEPADARPADRRSTTRSSPGSPPGRGVPRRRSRCSPATSTAPSRTPTGRSTRRARRPPPPGRRRRAARASPTGPRRPRRPRAPLRRTPSRASSAAGYLPDVLGCSLALADIQIAQGRLGDATRTFEAGLALAATSTPGCAAPPTCTSG